MKHCRFLLASLLSLLLTGFGSGHLNAQSPGGVSSGLVLWLKANQGTSTTIDNQQISFWNDQSGNNNNASQNMAGLQPRYKKLAFNGNPAIEFFNGSRFLNVNLAQIDNHSYSVYIVARRANSSSNQYIMGVQQTSPNPGMHFGYASNTSLKLEQYGNNITQAVTGYNAGTETPVILSAEFNTASGKAMKEMENGVLVSNTNANLASYLQNAQGVIGRGYNSSVFTGLVAEIIVFDRILNSTEKEAIETYLAIKYGITIPVAGHDFYDNAAFSYDQGGIGSDLVAQGLLQMPSISENDDAMVNISNASDLQDGEYLVWGNDDRLKSFAVSSGNNCSITEMMERTWMVKETGETGTVTVSFDLTGVVVANPDDIVLLIDKDGDGFDDESPVEGTYAAPFKKFDNIDLETGQALALGVGASTYYAVASGNASDPIWAKTPMGAPMSIPSFCGLIDVVIQSGFTVDIDIPDLECHDFVLENTATLNLTSNQLSIAGDATFTGSLNAGTGTIRFNGDNFQPLNGGTLNFYNMICDNPSYVQILATHLNLSGFISMVQGELKTAGRLTLTSSASGTGMIGPLLTGDITGNVTVQRYHNALAGGWVNLCSPIQNRTVQDWNDDLITTGFPGSDYPTYGLNNVQYYNETNAGAQNVGFTGVSNITDPIQNRKGYFVYMNSGAMNLDVTGSIFKGNVNLPITYTNTGNPSGDGWNLVGNPYACTIDWDNASGMTRTNVNNAIYIWDASINQYASYVNGVGNNGGTSFIPPSQSFWVVTNASSPALTINENAKSNTQVNFKSAESQNEAFSLSVTNGMYSDQVTMIFNSSATSGYDQSYDAFKLVGPATNINMSCLSTEGYELSVNALPKGLDAMTIPVRIVVPQAGTYTISHNGTDDFANGSCVVLKDLLTGMVYDLSSEKKISVEISPDQVDIRFVLEIGAPVISSLQHESCPATADGSATVIGNGSGPWNFTWKNEAGDIIREVLDSEVADVLSSLEGGGYSVTISPNGGCQSNTVNFEISSPTPIETTVEITPETCAGYSDGNALISISGGSGKYDVLWSNGTDNTRLNDVSAGEYTAFITDENNCTQLAEIEVPLADVLKAGFETVADYYELKNGVAVVEFFSTGENAESIEWNFGDNTIGTIEENPVHMFNAEGEYIVTQLLRNNECEVLAQKSIVITEPEMNSGELAEQVNGVITESGIQLTFSFGFPREIIVNAYNILGQRLIEPITGIYQNETIAFSEKIYAAQALIEIVDAKSGERTLIRLGS